MIGRLDGAALEEQLGRGKAGFATGCLKGLGLRLVAIGERKAATGQRANFRRQAEGLQLDPALDGERLLTLFFKSGQSSRGMSGGLSLKRPCPCGENRGRCLEGQQTADASIGPGHGRSSRGQNPETKNAVIDALPEEIRFDAPAIGSAASSRLAAAGFSQSQENRCRLDLAGFLSKPFRPANELSLSVRTVPVLKDPSSSNNTFIAGL